MSQSFASACLRAQPFTPTARTLRTPKEIKLGLGIVHNVTLHHEDVEMSLDFHIFDIQDFDVLIGHPLETLFDNPSKTGEISKASGRHFSNSSHSSQELDGRISLSVPIEVLAVAMFETPESSLEKNIYTEPSMKEEDEFGKVIDFLIGEKPPRPPVELKPLPKRSAWKILRG